MFLLKIHKGITIAGLVLFCASTVVAISEQLLQPDFISSGLDMVIPAMLVLALPILFYVFSIGWNNKLRSGTHSDLFFALFFIGIIYLLVNAIAAYSIGEQVFTTRETNIFSVFFGADKDDKSPVLPYYFVTSLMCIMTTILSLLTMIAIKKSVLNTRS